MATVMGQRFEDVLSLAQAPQLVSDWPPEINIK